MNIKDIKPGMKVIISDDISITHLRHSSGGTMRGMRGNIYEVEYVRTSSVRVNGYTWAPEDLKPVVVKKPKPQMFHFDVNNL